MEISTSTNLCAFRPDGGKNGYEFCIRLCAAGGYRALDLNFCEAMNPNSRWRGDGWEAYIEDIQRWGEENGVVFTQAHLPYYELFGAMPAEEKAFMDELIRRAVIACGRLHIPWAVTHPGTVYAAGGDMRVSRQANLEYFSPLAELAAKSCTGLALENDFEYIGGCRQRIYCADAHQLAELAYAFHAPETVGVCYDFGHGNLTGGFHGENLAVLGSQLKAVHIQDNRGDRDSHLLPFLGNIDWHSAMTALADTGYERPLTFEVQEYGRYFPNDLKPMAVAESLRVGKVLLDWFMNAKNKRK